MELRLKKRIVGFSLLVALGLIVIPLFFGHSVTSDELQLSSRVPNPPTKPGNFALEMPSKSATVPAIASASASSPSAGNSHSPVVFEQTESTSGANPVQATPPMVIPEVAKTTGTPPAATKSPVQTVSNETTTIHPNTAPASVPEDISTMVATPTTTAHKTTTKSTKTKATSSTAQHKTKPPKAAPVAQAWAVQLGVFSDKINAENLMKKLQSQGYSAYLHSTKTTQGTQIKVLVGPELRRADADSLVEKLHKSSNLKGIVVKADI